MNHPELLAQSIGILAMAFNILSYQQKTQKRVIGCTYNIKISA